MVPEIRLLGEKFNGRKWDRATQTEYMQVLANENFFNGSGTNDPAFSARDRINRAPQSLGFVSLAPAVSLTSAGNALINSANTEEIFLRQLLKFQIPSPLHIPSAKAAHFNVKPYLEILRLIRHLGTLKFDELKIFALQLTDYKLYEQILGKIKRFRADAARNKGSYRKFDAEYTENELRQIYMDDIKRGTTSTRESRDNSIIKFLKTKASNMRDYADACFRYLRATGLVNISHVGKSLSIVPEKKGRRGFHTY